MNEKIVVFREAEPLDFFKIPNPQVSLKKIASTVEGPFWSSFGEQTNSLSPIKKPHSRGAFPTPIMLLK